MYTSRAILAVSVFLVVGDAFRKKSSKIDAELDGGSFVEAEANIKAAEHAQTLKDMKDLAHKVVAGKEKISDKTLEALKQVELVIQKAADEVRPQFVEHQDELDDANESFYICTADYMQRTEEIHGKEGKRTGELEDIHNKNRSIEKQALKKKENDCKVFQAYNDGYDLHLPSCVHAFENDLCAWEFRSKCIKELADWSSKANAKYDRLRKPCQDAWEEHKNASKDADVSQGKFEHELCRWGVKLNDACDNFKNGCWYRAVTNREKVHKRISTISEPALQAEFKAIENIKCYMNVLKASEENMPAVLKGCDDRKYKEELERIAKANFSNTYHPIPDRIDCLTVPAPCDETWRQETYAEQSWYSFTAGQKFCHVFPNGAETVDTIGCVEECPNEEPTEVHCFASVYSEDEFTGNVATFGVGNYEHDEFVSRGPLRNNKASSIKVQGPPGCKATVYGEDHFNGWEVEFPRGNYTTAKFLAQGAKNNEASSIKVTLG